MNGANHSGTITLNDIDPWTITAAAGERIIVSLAETGVFNATFQPQIRVSGPTGAQVAQNTQQFQAAQVDFYAPTAGTYTIVVGSFDLNGTGDYRLTVVKAPGSLTIPAGDQGGPLSTSTLHTGSIALGDIDPWTFVATPNQRIVINFSKTGVFNAAFQPQIRVCGPTGAQVSQNVSASTAVVDFVATAAGTYTVIVGSFDLNGIGDYTIILTRP